MSYDQAHRRVTQLRGPASQYACQRCGRPARDWAYDHADPQECSDANGRRRYGTPEHYQPMCVRCHAGFDEPRNYQYVVALAINSCCVRCDAAPGQFCRTPGGKVRTGPHLQHVNRIAGIDFMSLLYGIKRPNG